MPFGIDLIPGVNVGNAIKQFATGEDYDVFPGYSNSNGQETVQDWANNDRGLDDIGYKMIEEGKAKLAAQAANTGGSDPTGPYTGGGGGGGGNGATDTSAADLAYLDDQEGLLRGILSSAQNTLNNGLTQIGDSYNKERDRTNQKRTRADQGYDTQREDTYRDRSAAIGQVNAGARTLSDSVRRMLGMASGANSSAYQQVAPNMIARDASQKRSGVFDTSGRNLRDIDSADEETALSFSQYLEDLAAQKKQKEMGLREGILTQEQGIHRDLGEVARQRSAIQGGNYDAMRAASAPFQAEVSSRQSQLDNLFNQFRSPYQTRDIQAKAPALADYTVDRTAIQANQNAGSASPDSPYQQFLKKKFNEGAA